MPDAHAQNFIESWVLRILRVPPRPEPPDGSPDSMKTFRAGENYYSWCLLIWALSNVFILGVLIALHFLMIRALRRAPDWVHVLRDIVEVAAWIGFAASVIITFTAQRLNYALRWYMVTDRSLRIRSGIFELQELTMTFSNIQEIRVTAGPLQNLMKLADVEVQSAGGSADSHGSASGHTGRFAGVSNANEIRDLIVDRLRQYRDSGLGESHVAAPSGPGPEIEAARAVLAEVRALGAQV